MYLVLFTLGQRETIQSNKPQEFKEDRDAARRRNNAFNLILNSKRKLLKDLDWQYALIYFMARLGLLVIWGLPLLILSILGLIVSLNGVAIYITISAVLFAGLYFLTTGKAFNFSDFNEVLKIRIKNWVYGKSLHLVGDIEEIEKKALELKKSENQNVI